MNHQRGDEVTQSDALQHAKNTRLRNGNGRQAAGARPLKEGNPIHEVPQQEQDQRAAENLPEISAEGLAFPLAVGKNQGVAHGKEERWKDQVGRGEPMPLGVEQGRKSNLPIPGGIDDDHQEDGHSAKCVKGFKPFHKDGFRLASKITNSEDRKKIKRWTEWI